MTMIGSIPQTGFIFVMPSNWFPRTHATGGTDKDHPCPCGCTGPQNVDPSIKHYFAPYDDMGNKRTINNAVDCGWSAID